MAKPFIRKGIPKNSTLTIIVTGEGAADDQKFTTEGRLANPAGNEEKFDDQDLRQGVEKKLTAAGVYSGQVDVNFAAKAGARIQMEVLKKDGTKHVYDETVSRSSGLERVVILLIVSKAA